MPTIISLEENLNPEPGTPTINLTSRQSELLDKHQELLAWPGTEQALRQLRARNPQAQDPPPKAFVAAALLTARLASHQGEDPGRTSHIVRLRLAPSSPLASGGVKFPKCGG